MSKTSDYLTQKGVTMKEAHDFVAGNINTPSTIYKISDKYNITTEMLAEIMGGTTTKGDVKSYMDHNGYNTDVLDLSTTEYVTKKGANVQAIHDNIIAHIDSPKAVLALSKEYGLTTDMLADIAGGSVTTKEVASYFESHGINENELDDNHTTVTTASAHTDSEDGTEHVTLVGTVTAPAAATPATVV